MDKLEPDWNSLLGKNVCEHCGKAGYKTNGSCIIICINRAYTGDCNKVPKGLDVVEVKRSGSKFTMPKKKRIKRKKQ